MMLVLFFNEPEAVAQLKFKHRWEVSLASQYRDLKQSGFSELENHLDGLAMLSLEQTVTSQQWVFEIRPELRALTSQSLSTPASDISRISLIDTTRALDFHTQISSEDEPTDSDFVAVTDIEKLNIRFQGKQIEFLAGRNPFNLSIMRLSSIWNKFGKDCPRVDQEAGIALAT